MLREANFPPPAPKSKRPIEIDCRHAIIPPMPQEHPLAELNKTYPDGTKEADHFHIRGWIVQQRLNAESGISSALEALHAASQPDWRIWSLIPRERFRVNLFILTINTFLRSDTSEETRDVVMRNLEIALSSINPLSLSIHGKTRIIESLGNPEPVDIFRNIGGIEFPGHKAADIKARLHQFKNSTEEVLHTAIASAITRIKYKPLEILVRHK